MRVPQDGPPVIEAGDTEWVAEDESVFAMALEARQGPFMWTGSGTSPWPTRQDPVTVERAGVDRSKGRGGQGDEELGVIRHRGRDALSAPEPRGDELPSVGLVEARAGGADRRAPVFARHEEIARSELARTAVEDEPAQTDRV